MSIGVKSPRFSLVGHDGRSYGPRSFGRKKVVLAFFPQLLDEATVLFLKELRGGLGAFFSAGMVPVGVCPAQPEELSELRSKMELPFILLSDQDARLAKKYGLINGEDDYHSLRPSVVLLSEDTTLLAVLPDLPATGVVELIVEAGMGSGGAEK